jgi:hypothetical protein
MKAMGEKKTLQTMIKSQNLHTIVVESKHKQMMKARKPHTKVLKTKKNKKYIYIGEKKYFYTNN